MLSEFFVGGIPLPKGSKTRIGTRMVEVADMATRARSGGALKRWLNAIASTARVYRCAYIDAGPVAMRCDFFLPRPMTKRVHATAKPDLSKLARAVEDALNGIAYRDDAQICHAIWNKDYATEIQPAGVRVKIWNCD